MRLRETFKSEEDRAVDAELSQAYLLSAVEQLSSDMGHVRSIITELATLLPISNEKAVHRVTKALEALGSRGKDNAKGR
jgi:hypothetical protein